MSETMNKFTVRLNKADSRAVLSSYEMIRLRKAREGVKPPSLSQFMAHLIVSRLDDIVGDFNTLEVLQHG